MLRCGLPDKKSGNPRKSRERKRSKRLKRQQPERKEKYRKPTDAAAKGRPFSSAGAVFSISPEILKPIRRERRVASRGKAPAFRFVLPVGCRSAGLACPLGSSTTAGSSVRPNQGLKARPHALNRFALARKRFIAHFCPFPPPSLPRRP